MVINIAMCTVRSHFGDAVTECCMKWYTGVASCLVHCEQMMQNVDGWGLLSQDKTSSINKRKLSVWLGLVLGHSADTQLDWSGFRLMPWALCHISQTISYAVFAVCQGVLFCCANDCHQGVPLPIKGCTYCNDVWLGCAHQVQCTHSFTEPCIVTRWPMLFTWIVSGLNVDWYG